MLDRAENLLHDRYGGKEYWDVSAARGPRRALHRSVRLVSEHLGRGGGRWQSAQLSCLHPQTRRSMVFAKHLRAVGDEFRSKYLNSTNEADRIPAEEDWTKMKVVSLSLIRGM